MARIIKAYRLLLILILFCSPNVLGLDNTQHNTQQTIVISPQVALPIGIKIWFNESGGSLTGLTSWNEGENFASLGIGHFIWYPVGGQATFNAGFPRLIRYMESHGVNVPNWLHGDYSLYCPWRSRSEFLRAQYSSQMVELRRFLQQTIPIQAEYMTRHLEEIFPEMLASTPASDRPYICQQFYTLARTPAGIYALVDYLNFKGAGVSKTNPQYNYRYGTGLLQVLKGMRFAPIGYTPLQAYVWSAKNALLHRVERSTNSYREERWLGGWFKRLNTYLEGDREIIATK